MNTPKIKRITLFTLLFLAIPLNAQTVTTVVYQDFESPTLPAANGWSFGAQSGGKVEISTDKTLNFARSAGSIKGSYPIATGGMYVWGSYNLAHLKTNDIYIEFWAKMPKAKQGLKFLKIFGEKSGVNKNQYANTTFGLASHANGGLTQVSFGDGSAPENDTQNVINLNGGFPDWVGRSYGVASVKTPKMLDWSSKNWNDGWHHFRIRTKFNSGTTAANEVADGAYYLEIDGEVYVDAKGLLNRHYSNGPIERVSIFDWAQSGTSTFEVWYDNFRITTGGFYDLAPKPPVNPTINSQ